MLRNWIFRTVTGRMPPGAWREYWRDRLASRGHEHANIIARDPYEHWDLNCAPEMGADFDLFLALNIAFADPDHDLVRRFLSRAVEVADRAFAEDKFQNELCRGAYPYNVARALRIKAHCLSIMTGVTQEQLFREASRHFLKYCQHETAWTWLEETYYLNGVRTALLAGDHVLAETVYQAGQLPDGDEEPPILKALIDAARSGERLPAKAQASLEKLFERVRDPHHKKRSMPLEVMIGPFEIACVRDKYVVSRDGRIYWRRVLRDFAS